MNHPASVLVSTCDDFTGQDSFTPHIETPTPVDHREQVQALRAELDEVQPVISAAVLAATAFRLRDNDGLVSALRMLVGATRDFEERRASI